ncbi:restriction endonuclease [Idiomarina loihiensis]|uniref:restriction endonuclease n=1 Tax=Idiomarina TaxID=135575 RepID=UPI000D70EDB0|nr:MULTISPECIES: restriction endonuclease [Idiomarina]PWW34562.1 restriction endonuclease [Idiomarina loihiensis]TDP47692.1 restriction endonuclease [Idiomarina loihiensis]TDS23433.1 restriction endonuclease [Idiomarina sp. H2]
MWKFSGQIEYECLNCGHTETVDMDFFECDWVGSQERQMGPENIYELSYGIDCNNCRSDININFTAYEYPVESLNYVEPEVTGASTRDKPYLEHLPDLYEVQQFERARASTKEIILEVQNNPALIRNIDSRQFEELVAELFRNKGYEVELTKRTRDGGKDIIAISKDHFGIRLKYFIECKYYGESNKVGVDVVRALHGVKNTKDGPNKTIVATTSSFTADAVSFVEKEAASSWDISLADYDQIMEWIGSYGRAS